MSTLHKRTRRSAAAVKSQSSPALRPFFGYFGGKWRDTPKYYPAPTHWRIVEPFAGSAGYSLRFPDREVILYEIDPVVAGVWEYLIGVDETEILKIPDVSDDGCVDDLRIPQEAKWLVGFWLNRGVSRPRKSPSKWMREKIRPGSFWGQHVRNRIANQLSRIRHWKIVQASYDECRHYADATWFIDPPYQMAGKAYIYGSDGLNYRDLARWCRSRRGQVIVCENSGADWLPFKHLASTKTTRNGTRSKEVLWTRP